MALLSSHNLIRTISLLHLVIAYFLLVAPHLVVQQNVVLILGAAMRLPQSTLKQADLAAVILALFGLSDLTAASLTDVVALEYWLSNIPVRLAMLFSLCGYIFLFNKGMHTHVPLCDNLTFTWAFFELTSWFWVYTSMRQERQEIARKILQKKRQET